MRRDAMTYIPAMSLLILLLVNISSNAQGDEPFIQADVYNALYEAYVQCDDNFGQSRSEFITEKLEHDRGQISIESLKKSLESQRRSCQSGNSSEIDRTRVLCVRNYRST